MPVELLTAMMLESDQIKAFLDGAVSHAIPLVFGKSFGVRLMIYERLKDECVPKN